ncbi:OLC1v1001009C3 [Oldenlandia corymbosa var. corymbosa]|nr:OLC1v1001009C3 [Oldenlandia corymbosa var. corymbosa]
MCSRLDHVLGKEKEGFYWDLICNGHKLKISSLVLCRHHNKLVDVHEICENCLFSFATVNKSNSETYRLLVGKLGDGTHQELDHDHSLADHDINATDGRKCSCCNEHWIPRGHMSLLFPTQSIGDESGGFGSPLSATKQHDVNDPDEIHDVLYQQTRIFQTEKRSIDPLPHVGYEKVRMNSDSESEAVQSDDDFPTARSTTDQRKEIFDTKHEENDSHIDDVDPEKTIYPASSIIELEPLPDPTSVLCAPAVPGLRELKQEHVPLKTDLSATSDLISFDDVLQSSDAFPSPVNDSQEKESEKMGNTPSEMTAATNSTILNEKQSDLKSDTFDSGPQIVSTLELGDAYKLAVRGRQFSGKLLEQRSFKDSSRMSEDLKLLLSQLSAARGIEPFYDISPRISGNIDDFRTDDSNSVGIQMLQKRISLERNESNISLDGSIVSEIEGESEVDRLKRQVEHDKKLMNALYKELEEERNASAIAANQAMAMITRLQEEKAALQMEALQFIRMMEEQAEYDGEDLQKANDLLADKEREIQELEVELEAYKQRIHDLTQITEANTVSNRQIKLAPKDKSSITDRNDGDMSDSCSKIHEAEKCKHKNTNMNSSLPDRKHESYFILQSLRKLEKKLQLFLSNDGASLISNGENLCTEEKLETIHCELTAGDASLRSDEIEKLALVEHSVAQERRDCAQGETATQYEDNLPSCAGSIELQLDRIMCQDDESELKKEFLVLTGRLEALEAEFRFLENSIKSLGKGDEGLKFIQDIASQVRELHAISFKSSN